MNNLHNIKDQEDAHVDNLLNRNTQKQSPIKFGEFDDNESLEKYFSKLFTNDINKTSNVLSSKEQSERYDKIDSLKKDRLNSFSTDMKKNVSERKPYMRVPDEHGNIVSLTAPLPKEIKNSIMLNNTQNLKEEFNTLSKLNRDENSKYSTSIERLQKQSENFTLNTFLNSNRNYSISEDNLFRQAKDPRINIENVKKLIMQNISFMNIDQLRLYCYRQGYYKGLSKNDMLIEINRSIPSDIKSCIEPSDLRKLYDAILLDPNIQLKTEFLQDNKYLINCNNGVLDFSAVFNKSKPNIYEHSSTYRFINCVQADYIPNYTITNSNFERFIMNITGGNIELILLIQEVLGYAFSNFNNAKKAFLLYGESNSGKSVLLKIISSICGEDNVSNVPLQNLSDEKYVAELYGKLINIFSELPDKGITDTGTFKALVSETDKVIARKLFKDPFSFYNKCKLFFATNNLPEIKTPSHNDSLAFFNRLIIIPFKYGIPENLQDKELIHKLIYERNLIFSWSIDGLVRYINNGFRFSECAECNLVLNHYFQNSSFVLSFINERCLLDKNSHVHSDKLFEAFNIYCKENLLDTPSNKDKRYLKNILKEKYNLHYKRLNRRDGNKYGFDGLKLL